MKNLISAIILCLFCWFATDAQTINACSYNKAVTVYDKINSDPSSQENSEAIRIIDRLVKPIGLPSNFIPVKIDGIENCAAITKNGLRFIVYDNVFLQALSSYDNKDWIKLSIFAHEIGHHLSGHTLYNSTSNEEQRTNELQADKFSGFLLQKLGASIEQATKGISILGDINDSNTHPAKGKRINAITQGYNEAENQENSIVSKREPSAEKFYYEALVSYHQLLIDSNYIDVGVNSFSKFRSSADKLKLEKMEENLSTAIKLNSNFTQAYKLRAGVRMLRDNVDGSERDLKEVLLFDSRNIDALTEFAVIEIRKQNFKSALNYL
ncbi:MAG: M48 family metalloprotease, partial [Saprospiraceae bacterium]